MAGKFLKGALVEFMPTFLVPMPNVIVFQFNPETMTHTWTQAETAQRPAAAPQTNPLAVRGSPGESFSFTLLMDAVDMIADGGPASSAIAQASGVYSRLAALEMLLYPTSAPAGGLVGSVSAAAGAVSAAVGGSGLTSGGRSVPASQVPVVLFIWGPGRIVPVRVTGLTITEKLYDELLNPTHAEAQISMRVLLPEELDKVTGPMSDIAKVAYKYSQDLRQALATANLAESAESIIGMLPVG